MVVVCGVCGGDGGGASVLYLERCVIRIGLEAGVAGEHCDHKHSVREMSLPDQVVGIDQSGVYSLASVYRPWEKREKALRE